MSGFMPDILRIILRYLLRINILCGTDNSFRICRKQISQMLTVLGNINI